MINKVWKKISCLLGSVFGPVRCRRLRKKLSNTNFSLISQNCLGGVIYHDFGLRFLSPTINLYMSSNDFLVFVENIREFENSELVFFKTERAYPVANLSSNGHTITVYFVHYKTEEEANEKWKNRYQRINYDNLIVLMTDRDGFNDDTLERFKGINYKKLLFSSKKINIPECIYCKQYRKEPYVGDLISYRGIFGKRNYEVFNFIHWINTN